MKKQNEDKPHIFGVRHFSPAGAYYVREYLDKVKPKIVLIEGPSDFNDLIDEIVGKNVSPPIAIMAYTLQAPIETIVYPFAEFSPEYQAILWAKENKVECRFCDLPSSIFLGVENAKEKNEEQGESLNNFIHRKIDEYSEDTDSEVFWERVMEQASDYKAYHSGARDYGKNLRELTLSNTLSDAKNIIRESYMSKVVCDVCKEGYKIDEIAMIVGAFHVEGIESGKLILTEKEVKDLPKLETKKTLMPYSYYKLSTYSNYGAGNKAPGYYEFLWKGFNKRDVFFATYTYLSKIAEYQRKTGNMVSSAQIIEAVQLAISLANIHDSKIPTLKDIQDAAITCMAHGSYSELVMAMANVEVGKKIGKIPQEAIQTSIQSDFYNLLKELKLEKYQSLSATELRLDLREKLRVQSEKAALMDLYRSYFFHKLRVLKISFAKLIEKNQENTTWSEEWVLQWSPEAEIEIVETILKGDTIEFATAFELMQRIDNATSLSQMADIVKDAFYCGMPKTLEKAFQALQNCISGDIPIDEIAKTMANLSIMLRYGDIRKLNMDVLIPILEQLFLRVCLILVGESACDNEAATKLSESIVILHNVVQNHDFLDRERWYNILLEIAKRDDLNTKISGLAMAILLESGKVDNETLGQEVERRLSKGIPAELGATWFEGLSMKNHYTLISRLGLWEKLQNYISALDEEEFKRALLFLRRAFADFSSNEKHDIAENIAEIWGLNKYEVSDVVNKDLEKDEEEIISKLEEFDFDDI
ncbi:DUF5682 family protein [Fusobacterium simiae]|uniref:DUF5682 family protein n=1 Tax=Fusobacterium TaxID=848 RepID=UPI001897B92B|nr:MULTISPECIES: DUF5682 family protein [Fusobacterium]MDC7955338.1 DUF5682 family protein [Fusobacterium simiae]